MNINEIIIFVEFTRKVLHEIKLSKKETVIMNDKDGMKIFYVIKRPG